jgi:hypothetical protein
MLDALAATLASPGWWSLALAGFLVRGGILVVVLPIVVFPTPAALATALSPTVSSLAFGGLQPALVGAIATAVVVALSVLAAVGLAGAWLDRELLREAADAEDLDVRWTPLHASLRDALALRLAGHLPTLAAAGYATFRLITAGYDELLAPGDLAVPLVLRIAGRAPDAIAVVLATWLAGEALGGLAARRAAAGASFGEALVRSARQLFSGRGLATLAVTSAVVAVALAPFLFAVGRAWEHLRDVLLGGGDVGFVASALLVLVASWILGLAILGAALAWRSAAWTAEIAPVAGPANDAATLAATPTGA